MCSCFNRILLRFDTKEFLNVLAMAFNAKRFTPQVKQRFADILLLVIFPNCSLAVNTEEFFFHTTFFEKIIANIDNSFF